jgi:hypothetical protein
MASASNAAHPSAWELSDRALTLTISLHRTNHILPWSTFLAAEGDDAAVLIRFLRQTIYIEGSGLSALLTHVSELTVSRITEPHRTDKFLQIPGARISALRVTANSQQ